MSFHVSGLALHKRKICIYIQEKLISNIIFCIFQGPSGHVVTPVRLALHQQGVSPSPAQPPPATPPKAPPTTTHSEVDAEALARNWYVITLNPATKTIVLPLKNMNVGVHVEGFL